MQEQPQAFEPVPEPESEPHTYVVPLRQYQIADRDAAKQAHAVEQQVLHLTEEPDTKIGEIHAQLDRLQGTRGVPLDVSLGPYGVHDTILHHSEPTIGHIKQVYSDGQIQATAAGAAAQSEARAELHHRNTALVNAHEKEIDAQMKSRNLSEQMMHKLKQEHQHQIERLRLEDECNNHYPPHVKQIAMCDLEFQQQQWRADDAALKQQIEQVLRDPAYLDPDAAAAREGVRQNDADQRACQELELEALMKRAVQLEQGNAQLDCEMSETRALNMEMRVLIAKGCNEPILPPTALLDSRAGLLHQ